MKHTLIAMVMLVLAGCASQPYRTHSPAEKRWLAHAVIGQAADCMTTSYALSNYPSIEEGNDIWWNPEDTGSLLATKVAVVGVAYLAGQRWPDKRLTIYKWMAVCGYGPALWNVGVMMGE